MSVFNIHGKLDLNKPGAARAMARCDFLAKISSMEDAICRTYLTEEHRQCNDVVSVWMQSAGMSTWVDAAGNCWGRFASKIDDAPIVILGSHLDTVPNAGRYDGILGVIAAIEVVEQLNNLNVALPYHIDIVGFGDEEGVRFGTTLLGSRAVAGTWQDRWFDLVDRDGISLGSALNTFGASEQEVLLADRSGENIKAYLELHIEQGPVLEQQNQPVGIVTSIAGARRYQVSFEGMAGHAGTVPMELRQDPLIAAAMFIQEAEKVAKLARVVATVGKVECFPGSVNVIPGRCELTLDIRSGLDASRDLALDSLLANADEFCRQRQIKMHRKEIHNAPAAPCASRIQRQTEDIIQAYGLVPVSMISGAGHDAMAFKDMTDVGMLFVRCGGGISHNPLESVTVEDVHHALNIFYEMAISQ